MENRDVCVSASTAVGCIYIYIYHWSISAGILYMYTETEHWAYWQYPSKIKISPLICNVKQPVCLPTSAIYSVSACEHICKKCTNCLHKTQGYKPLHIVECEWNVIFFGRSLHKLIYRRGPCKPFWNPLRSIFGQRTRICRLLYSLSVASWCFMLF